MEDSNARDGDTNDCTDGDKVAIVGGAASQEAGNVCSSIRAARAAPEYTAVPDQTGSEDWATTPMRTESGDMMPAADELFCHGQNGLWACFMDSKKFAANCATVGYQSCQATPETTHQLI
jgi:hypothetical protein